MRTLLAPQVIRSKNGIVMRTSDDLWVELSQEGDCNGIRPGDSFTLNGVDELVIGFSNELYRADSSLSWIWTLPKRERRLECREKDGTISKIKKTMRKAEKVMTADTTEEEIGNFLNS